MTTAPNDEPADRLAALRDRLTPEQLALVQQRLRGDGAPPPSATPTLPPPSVEKSLSFAQLRLWYLERSLDGPSRYVMAWAFDVAGPLDADALRTAATAVVELHPALRTGVEERDGVPVGVLRTRVDVAVNIEHVEAGADLDRLIHDAAREPFDLGHGELLRLRIFSASDVRHTLLVTVHHLVADARSMEVILADLAAAYDAARRGERFVLPPPVATYADFAAHQREVLDGDRLRRHLDFWADELRDAPLVLDLATTWPRPEVQHGLGVEVRRALPAELANACAGLARSQHATPFMVLLAALAVVLARHSGQEDLVIGVPVAGRTSPQLQRVVGLFVNTLPIRVDLRAAPTFHHLIERVRDAVLGGLDHQDAPFEHIVQRMRPPRRRDRAPLVQVLADLRQPATLSLAGASVIPRHLDGGPAKVDQQWSFVDRRGRHRRDPRVRCRPV